MNTIELTADLQVLIYKIRALPFHCYHDATIAAQSFDLQALAFIANMAEGKVGHTARRMSEMLDLADLMRGMTPRLIHGADRKEQA